MSEVHGIFCTYELKTININRATNEGIKKMKTTTPAISEFSFSVGPHKPTQMQNIKVKYSCQKLMPGIN